MKLEKPSARSSGAEAIREVFRNESRVDVTTDGQVFRVRIGDVSGAILKTRLSRIAFDQDAQYNPEDAIQAILSSAEVNAESKRLGVSQGGSLADHLVQEPMEGVPHLPDAMTNVTVEQALDHVAITFDAIVLYGEDDCPPTRRFYVSYGSLRTE